MGPTEHLIQDFAKLGHPLGAAIRREEAPQLVAALLHRLGATPEELNQSPLSLHVLERELVRWHQSLSSSGQSLEGEDLVQFVRELAAYVGIVLETHAGGEWRTTDNSLWGTEISFRGPVYVVKGSEIRQHPLRVFSLGNLAGSAWDAILAGVPPKLYQDYRDARAKKLRERL